jgi:hypothetical protein
MLNRPLLPDEVNFTETGVVVGLESGPAHKIQ